MSKKIVLFENRIDCCGCGACSDICPKNAIKMADGIGGYRYPQIDCSLCISCGTCLKVCPIKKRKTHDIEQKNKPHIKIVNYGMFNNFGAVIAASCLESVVRSMVPENYEVQTLDYDSDFECTNSYRIFRQNFQNGFDFIRLFFEKMHIVKPKDNCTDEVYHSDSILRNRRYKKFRNRFLNYSVSMNVYDLDNDDDNDKALICGSDVIWFPPRIFLRTYKGYYLDFGPENAKRISYAASVDSKVNFKLLWRWFIYKYRLRNFDFISVRETANLKFIQSATNKNAVQCIDPVLLFDAEDFENMLSESELEDKDEDYIYAYILMKNDEAFEYVKHLAKEKNMKIYYFADYYTDFGKDSVDCFSDGPAEFLHRIKNAKYIVTTSFHCIVFSMIFKKQFLAFDRGNDSIKIPDILELFKMSDRLFDPKKNSDIDMQIDFERTNNIIKEYRGKSLEFLGNALNDFRTEK